MSEILVAAVNASFSHTNIAVRSISLYCQKKLNVQDDFINFDEWTINQQPLEILRGILTHKPKIIMFSTYIWNIQMIEILVRNLRAFDSNLIIGLGGPEVSFNPQQIFSKLSEADFICQGEGEETVFEVAQCFQNHLNHQKKLTNDESKAESTCKYDFLKSLQKIKGLYLNFSELQNISNPVFFTGTRELICDLQNLVFPYPKITEPDSKIYYYESSRGCPFSCAYCMSSLDRRVRFMPLERVYKDLQFFLDNNVKLVKFVDRTYNLDDERYIAIWDYILNHHNGKTMFHFEIEAEYLSQNALDFLQKVPSGVMQFEIGVQSSNPKTLESVSRSPEIEKIAQNVKQIPKTIHCHLDLIAGLPYEDLQSFGKSFDFVMSLHPDEMQLGFLKVLYGTKMKEIASQNEYRWMKTAPYEILSTPELSFGDVCFLKDLEVVLDAFYNSKNFEKCMFYIEEKYGFWNFFCEITEISQKQNLFSTAKSPKFWYEFLADYSNCKNDKILYELLRFDFVKTGKKGGFPDWYIHHYDKNKHRLALEQNGGVSNSRIDFAYSEYEEFEINPLLPIKNNIDKTASQELGFIFQKTKILFFYENKFNDKKSQQIIIE